MVDVSERVFEVLESSMDRDVVPLGSAFPSPRLFPLQRLGQALARAARQADPRSALDDLTPGSMALRRQIARRYLADGLALSPSDLVITNGALEALNLCLAAVTRPGGAVVIESPCFYGALQALERMGLSAIEVPTHPGEGMDLAALETAVQRHRPQAIWLMTSFQNPLGSLMPEARKKALVELATRHQLPLIEDDVYGELYFGEHRPPPAKAFDTEGWVLHCASFSVPGARLARGLDRSGPLHARRGAAKAHHHAGHQCPQPAGAGRLPGRRWRGPPPAPPAPEPGPAAGPHGIGHCPPLSARHAGHAARGRLLHVDRAAAVLRCAGPAPRSAGARHQRGAGADLSASQAFGHCLRLNYGHDWSDETGQALATLGELARAMQSLPAAKAAG